MNPLTQVRRVAAMCEREAARGVSEAASWHHDYRGSAWVFVGGLPYELSEGDVICILSQYGEIVNLNLVRDKATGKSKGFAFICYEDQRSTNLAVDNFNGIKVKGRTLRVDHVSEYRVPKEDPDADPVTRALRDHGCGPLAPTHPPTSTPTLSPAPTPRLRGSSGSLSETEVSPQKKRKHGGASQGKKKMKKKKMKKNKDKKTRAAVEKLEEEDLEVLEIKPPCVRVKIEKSDTGYEHAAGERCRGRHGETLGEGGRERGGERGEERGERHGEGQTDRHRDRKGHSGTTDERDGESVVERRVKIEIERGAERVGERERQRNDDRERDCERVRQRDRERDSERKRQRDSEQERQRDGERQGSERDKYRDGERQRDGERERQIDSGRERQRDGERERQRDGERLGSERDKHRDSERQRDSERDRDRGRERNTGRDVERDSMKSKDRERQRR